VAANPLSAWWKKNSKTAVIAVVVIAVLWTLAHGNGAAKTKEKEIPDQYASKGRVVLIHAKQKSKSAVPLVLVLSDDNTKTKVFETDSGASALADRKHFALVYPEPVASQWQVDANGADAQYLKDIIAYMSTNWTAVDTSRVYIWGLGEGARLALALACANPAQFAAVGVVGQFDPDPGPNCDTEVPTDRERVATLDKNASARLWSFSSSKIRH
jgi:polyhydroxybutyrate depolymerase